MGEIPRPRKKHTIRYAILSVIGLLFAVYVFLILTNVIRDYLSIDASQLWFDSVRRGDMPVQVRESGKLVGTSDTAHHFARIEVRDPDSSLIAVGQPASIDVPGATSNDLILTGKVTGISSPKCASFRNVEVSLDGTLPISTRAGSPVMVTITVDTLHDALWVGRPAHGIPGESPGLFRLSAKENFIERVPVRLGRASFNTIEIVSGLRQGDKLVLSDMSDWYYIDVLKIK